MSAIDGAHAELPFYGVRRIRGELAARGLACGRGHVATLMRGMGISAIAPKRRTSKPAPDREIYPRNRCDAPAAKSGSGSVRNHSVQVAIFAGGARRDPVILYSPVAAMRALVAMAWYAEYVAAQAGATPRPGSPQDSR